MNKKVKVISIRPESCLLNTEPYWHGPKLDTYASIDKVNEIKIKVDALKLPCLMGDTGKKDLYQKRILIDENGNTWSETHFFVQET